MLLPLLQNLDLGGSPVGIAEVNQLIADARVTTQELPYREATLVGAVRTTAVDARGLRVAVTAPARTTKETA